MGAVIFLIVLTALMAILSVVLLRGHGAMLIAGYNTSSPAERARYDEKRMCRAVGWYMLTVSALLAAMTVLGYRVETGRMAEADMLPFALLMVGVLLVGAVRCIVYINTKCKKKK